MQWRLSLTWYLAAKFSRFVVRCSLTPPPLASLAVNTSSVSFRESGGVLWVLFAVRPKSSRAETRSLTARGRRSGAALRGVSALVGGYTKALHQNVVGDQRGRDFCLHLCCVVVG